MKEFSVVRCYGVHLFGGPDSVPLGMCYGRVDDTVYTFNPTSGKRRFFTVKGKELTPKKVNAGTMVKIDEIIYQNRKIWDVKQDVHVSGRQKPLTGAPLRREVPINYIYRATNRPMSTETCFSSGEFCKGPVDDGKKPLPKRDGMKTPQFSKQEREEKRKENERSASVPIHSKEERRKIYGDFFVDAPEKRDGSESYAAHKAYTREKLREAGLEYYAR